MENDVDEFKEDGKISPHLLANYILGIHKIITTRDNEEMFIYREGVYTNPAEAIIKEMTQELVPEITAHQKREVLEQIMGLTYVNREEFNRFNHLVWVENGILDLKEKKMIDFNPNLISTVKIPVKNDESKDCPKIKKFISEVVNREDVPVIQELIGYCLLKNYPFHKAFMFVGEGANGKSTLLSLIARFLSEDNVASVSLWELCQNRFAPARLFGKLANIYADIPSAKLTYTGQFKMATGQDLMPYEKKHRDASTFRNFAKLFFSANQLPETEDITDAFFRRWIIINFPNIFTENADPNILDKIATPEELSGLLNWGLEGLERLLERGGFSYSKTQDEIKRKYIKLSDSLRSFVMENCEKASPDKFITKDDFYENYTKYCDEEALEAKTKSLIGRNLPTILPFVSSIIREIEEKKTRVWNSIKFKDTKDTDIFTIIDLNKVLLFNGISNILSKKVSSVPKNLEQLQDLKQKFGKILTKPTLEYHFSLQQIEKWLREGILAETKPDQFEVIVGNSECTS